MILDQLDSQAWTRHGADWARWLGGIGRWLGRPRQACKRRAIR